MYHNRNSMDQCHIPVRMCHRAVAWTSDITSICAIGLRGLKLQQARFREGRGRFLSGDYCLGIHNREYREVTSLKFGKTSKLCFMTKPTSPTHKKRILKVTSMKTPTVLPLDIWAYRRTAHPTNQKMLETNKVINIHTVNKRFIIINTVTYLSILYIINTIYIYHNAWKW